MNGSRTKWYNFGGDPDHASDPGVQSPKSGSSGSEEVCALWAYLISAAAAAAAADVCVCVCVYEYSVTPAVSGIIYAVVRHAVDDSE